jgi:alanyl-tRNA synthetase
MTHVLNYALKAVLIDASKEVNISTCDQKGSLVDDEKLRFDFSWNAPLTPEQIKAVEDIVVTRIRQEVPVYAQVVPLSAATQINALRKVFGEKYPDPVRVVSVGADVNTLLADPSNAAWGDISVEFCGGTHLTNTKQAEDFVLVEESGIAKGIRRIVGHTRGQARQDRAVGSDLLRRLSAMESAAGSRNLEASFKLIKLEVGLSYLILLHECTNFYDIIFKG